MANKKDGNLFRFAGLFSKSLPNAGVLILLLLGISVVFGIATVALLHHSMINGNLSYIAVYGAIAGIFIIMLPALLTSIIIKGVKRMMPIRHIIFIIIISCFCYSVFVLLGSIVYMATGNSTVASAIIIVGDASIFGWWFFMSKFVLGQGKRSALVALTQPTLNILLYIPGSVMIFSFSTPINILFLKLYAGIAIFLGISYLIINMFERPVRRSLGISSVDTFSQMLQNWLFDINVNMPAAGSKPISAANHVDVDTHTLLFKRRNGSLKALLFLPEIHYGPAGYIGSSNFPFLLERYASARYRANAIIMHGAVNEDRNSVSANQFGLVRAALDKGVREAKAVPGKIGYSESRDGAASVKVLGFGDLGIVTLSRAPRVAEDFAPEVAALLKKLLNRSIKVPVLVEAHNSRFENAPDEELDGVKLNSSYMNEYVAAVNALGRPQRSSARFRVGVGSVELYHRLGRPHDLGQGNLNVLLFRFNSHRYAMVHINANNMLPAFRDAVLARMRDRYGFDAEVYTTDTHVINTLQRTASNVLGRRTRIRAFLGPLDEAVEKALANMEEASVSYAEVKMKRYAVWGPNARERITEVMDSVLAMARYLVPLVVVGGFLVAGWVITLI